jgi:phosphoglycerate dehydrogenase-like enzyme
MRLLQDSGHHIVLPEGDGPFSAAELVPMVPGVNAIIAGNDQVDRSVIDAADDLLVIGKHGTGTDTIDVEAARAADVAVVTAPGTNAESVAELAVAMMLSSLRQLRWHHSVVSGDQWSRRLGKELGACTVAVVGFGKVGQHVARLVRAFGAWVRVVEPYPDEGLVAELSCSLMTLEEAVKGAHVLSLHCPLNEQSRELANDAILSRLADAAVLVNTARAGLVDGAAVRRALVSGRLSCYATDVFDEEPPKDRSLARMDGTLCTPHIGAYTVEAVERTGIAAANAVLDVLAKGQR